VSFTRYAVIMAGGSGERFWPLSRRLRPKQLLRLTNPDETLLEEAVNRIEPLVGRENTVIATATHLERPIREAGLLPPTNVVAEPDKRNTLGCLVWAAGVLSARHENPDEVSMAVLTADHKIGLPEAFRRTVDRALGIAEQTGALVTIGIVPDRPETGYGYIEFDHAALVGTGSKVTSFREKPSLEAAKEYLSEGRFLWNSGMFFWTLKSFYDELRDAEPEVERLAQVIANSLRLGKKERAEEAFQELPNRSIDYVLMERAKKVAVVPSEFPWDDVGAWDSLERTMPVDEHANVVQGQVLAVDTVNSILYNENPAQTVTIVGGDNLIVIVTGDAVMICPKSDAQRVKEIVAQVPKELL